MNIEDVIEKLNCATRCHANARHVLVGEAIEMLNAVDHVQKKDIKQLIVDFESMDNLDPDHPIFQLAQYVDRLLAENANLIAKRDSLVEDVEISEFNFRENLLSIGSERDALQCQTWLRRVCTASRSGKQRMDLLA